MSRLLSAFCILLTLLIQGHNTKWPKTPESFMYYRIEQWFNQTFPHAKIETNYDSVIAGTTAWYLSYCIGETMPEDADLVLVELDINQLDTSPKSLRATEGLLRSMLSLPNQPAVIYLSIFALMLSVKIHFPIQHKAD